jgi:type III secretory pathway component EscS
MGVSLVQTLLVMAPVAVVITGLLAAFTQIQDPAVSLVLRVIGVGLAIVLFASSIGHQLVAFANRIWPLIAAVSSGA